MSDTIKERLEYLRGELRAERISYEELAELQSLAPHIEPGDVELLEPAGVPEHDESATIEVGDTVRSYDFPDRTGHEDDSYVEGIVEEIGRFDFPDCDRYKIRCTRRLFGGQEYAGAIGEYYYPPVNGTPRMFSGGVCNGVRKAAE